MRARDPDDEGYVERDGVKLLYEIHGAGDPTILLMPTWPDRIAPTAPGPTQTGSTWPTHWR
jgi:hypothetical protein